MSKHDSTRTLRVKTRDNDRRIARKAKRQLRIADRDYAANMAPVYIRPTVEVTL